MTELLAERFLGPAADRVLLAGADGYASADGACAWTLEFQPTPQSPVLGPRPGSRSPAGVERVTALARQLADAVRDDYRPEEIGWALIIPYEAPPSKIRSLDDWYEREHVRLLHRCPDWKRTRRFRVDRCWGAGWNRLVVHELTSDSVLTTPEVRFSMSTRWRADLAAEEWFLRGGRDLLRRL